VSAAGSLTVSATDYLILRLIKRKATTFSVTEQIGTVNVGQTSTWTNKPGFSKAGTVATTASVVDMDPGDSILGHIVLNGAQVGIQSPISVCLTIEEK
jgi:hypothetical protein